MGRGAEVGMGGDESDSRSTVVFGVLIPFVLIAQKMIGKYIP